MSGAATLAGNLMGAAQAMAVRTKRCAVAAPLPTAEAVRRLVGIVCLAYRLQIELGLRFSHDGQGQRRRAQWTVTDRVSYFWCGQQMIHDPGADWRGWLAAQWDQLIAPDGAVSLAIAA